VRRRRAAPSPGRVPRPGRIRDCRPPRLRGHGEPPRARGRARVVARRPPWPGVEVGGRAGGCALGRVRACSAGRYPRFTPAPIRQPRPSVTQRSGKRRHLRQQEAEMLSGDLLLGKRRVPPVTRLHREAGGAQGVRSIRIAQGTVNKLGGGALRGSARVRAALLRSGRPGSRPTGAPRDRYNSKPAGGVPPPDPRRGEGRHSARRRRQRRRPAARGARRGPARTTKTHHPTAPLRTPPRASAHAPPRPLPGAGRSPYQPHECQLAIPPPRGEGERAD